MSNIKDMGEAVLNTLHNQLTDLLVETRDFMLGEGSRYKAELHGVERLKYTTTVLYLNSALTSGLAELYMLFGYKHNELTYEQLKAEIAGIDRDKIKTPMDTFHNDNPSLNRLRVKADEMYRRIHHVATGGINE